MRLSKLGTTSDNEESGEDQDDQVEDEPVHEEVSDTDESVDKEVCELAQNKCLQLISVTLTHVHACSLQQVCFRDKQKQVDTVTDVQPFIEALAESLVSC